MYLLSMTLKGILAVLLCTALLTELAEGRGTGGARKSTEVSTSVIITSFWDMEGSVMDNRRPCEAVVQRSRGYNARSIAFIVTVNAVGSYGGLWRYSFKEPSGNLVPANKDNIARWQAGLTTCFRAAVEAGFNDIHIVPHVDPVEPNTGNGVWRNVVKFDPLKQLEGYSYVDVVLLTAARAFAATAKPTTSLHFSVLGESGLTAFVYPTNWVNAAATAKQAAAAGGHNTSLVKMGISLNWDKVCGCVEPDEPDALLYNRTYTQRLGRFLKAGGLKTIDLKGVRALLDGLDFLGISGYGSMQPNKLDFNEMERSIQTAAYEFSLFNISLRSYMFNKNKPFFYSEQGLGGCTNKGTIAPNASYVAIHPWSGIWPNSGQYERAADPWKKPALKEYRRNFYDMLAKWAGAGGTPHYRIDGIYVWSVGTWDVHGVSLMNNGNNTYGDVYIQSRIRALNKRANGNTGT